MRFSVIIATLGRAETLASTLDSVLSCAPPPDEVLVVDGDGGAEPVVASGRDVKYVRGDPGLTRQRNLGLERISGDVAVFLDDDVAVARDLFAGLAAAYQDPTVIGVTGRVVEDAERRFGRRFGAEGGLARRLLFGRRREGTMSSAGYPRRLTRSDRPLDVEFMPGCFMTARRDSARAIGFDERLRGYALAEDEDFSYRLSLTGRIRYEPGLVVEHRTLGKAAWLSPSRARAFNRQVVVNRSYLFRKNFAQTPAARVHFALLLATLLVHRVLNREWQGALGLIEGAWQALRRGP